MDKSNAAATSSKNANRITIVHYHPQFLDDNISDRIKHARHVCNARNAKGDVMGSNQCVDTALERKSHASTLSGGIGDPERSKL